MGLSRGAGVSSRQISGQAFTRVPAEGEENILGRNFFKYIYFHVLQNKMLSIFISAQFSKENAERNHFTHFWLWPELMRQSLSCP